MYISLIVNIRPSLIYVHGFQLLLLLPKLIAITAFVYTNRNLQHLKRSSYRLIIIAEAAKVAYANKTRACITSKKLGSRDFWQIANSVFRKVNLIYLYLTDLWCFHLHLKQNWSLKSFLRTLNLMIQTDISLPAFLFRTNLKICNISVFSKFVKNGVTNLDSLNAPDPHFILVLVLRKCELQLSYVLAELFNMHLKESCYKDCWKILSLVPVCKNCAAKKYLCLLFMVSKIYEKLVNNKLFDHLEKYFLLYKLKSCGISVRVFGFVFSH